MVRSPQAATVTFQEPRLFFSCLSVFLPRQVLASIFLPSILAAHYKYKKELLQSGLLLFVCFYAAMFRVCGASPSGRSPATLFADSRFPLSPLLFQLLLSVFRQNNFHLSIRLTIILICISLKVCMKQRSLDSPPIRPLGHSFARNLTRSHPARSVTFHLPPGRTVFLDCNLFLDPGHPCSPYGPTARRWAGTTTNSYWLRVAAERVVASSARQELKPKGYTARTARVSAWSLECVPARVLRLGRLNASSASREHDSETDGQSVRHLDAT